MKKIKLGDVLDVRRGPGLSGEYYASSGDKIRLTLGNFIYPGDGFKQDTSKDDLFFIGKVKPEYILKKGDIIIPLTEQVRGLLGSVATIPEDDLYIQNGDVALVLPNETVLDKRFAYYLVSSPIVRKQLDAGSQQTKIRHTSPAKIKKCVALIPEKINKQEQIANCLDKIKDKINNNVKIIEELESMVELIYDYWFLQFDFPDEDGNPYKSSGGEMIYSEILRKDIPAKWQAKQLSNSLLFNVIKPGIKSFEGAKIYLETADVEGSAILEGKNTTYNNRENRANMQPVANSVWFAKMKNSIKHIVFTQQSKWMIDNYILSTGFTGFDCKDSSISYIWSYINNPLFEKTKDFRAGGSTQEAISDDELKLFNILEPSDDILIKYNQIVLPIINKHNNIIIENKKLSEMRDFLIPLLMNGQATIV